MGVAAPQSTLPVHPAHRGDMAARRWEATRASPFLLAWILRHLFVCLSLGNQERMEKKKKIDITLSPMSHCSQLAETPHSSPKMLQKPWGKGRRARGAPRPPALPPDLCPILLLVPTGRDTG